MEYSSFLLRLTSSKKCCTKLKCFDTNKIEESVVEQQLSGSFKFALKQLRK